MCEQNLYNAHLGFLNSGPNDIVSWIILFKGGGPTYRWMLRSIPGLYPLEFSSTQSLLSLKVVTTINVFNNCQMLPEVKIVPRLDKEHEPQNHPNFLHTTPASPHTHAISSTTLDQRKPTVPVGLRKKEESTYSRVFAKKGTFSFLFKCTGCRLASSRGSCVPADFTPTAPTWRSKRWIMHRGAAPSERLCQLGNQSSHQLMGVPGVFHTCMVPSLGIIYLGPCSIFLPFQQ